MPVEQDSNYAAAPAILGREYKMPFGGKWNRFIERKGRLWYVTTDASDYGEGHLRELNDAQEKDIRALMADYVQNPLAYFLPHGVEWHKNRKVYGQGEVVLAPSAYPKRWKNDGVAFVNDWTNDYVVMLAPRKTGKSYVAAAKIALYSLPSNPNWHCFLNHGIEYREWTGPKRVVVGSFKAENLLELWRVYQEVLPRAELGRFAPNWGDFPGEKGRAKTVNVGDGKPHRVVLSCGSELIMLTYGQSQATWENFKANALHADEQIKWILLRAWEDGTRTMGDYTPAVFSLSGFCLDDRPDTGAAGSVKLKIWDGRDPRIVSGSKKIGRYNMDIESTPNAIMTDKKKRQAYDQYVNPEIERSPEDARRGHACYWPGWEPGGGLVIKTFDPELHVIPPYERDHPVVVDATKYRGIDHGLGRPCAVSVLEVFPWGDIVVYAEYYKEGGYIQKHAAEIVKVCGNTLVESHGYGGAGGEDKLPYSVFEEVQTVPFAVSVLDGRSFASPSSESARTMGQVYNDAGLMCMPAKGHHNDKMLPTLLEKFEIEPDRKHIMWHFRKNGVISEEVWLKWLDAHGGVYVGAPQIYFVNTLVAHFEEFSMWANDLKTGKPKSENDHLAGGALKYIVYEDPVYLGRYWDDDRRDRDVGEWRGERIGRAGTRDYGERKVEAMGEFKYGGY